MSLELRFQPEVRISAGGRTLFGLACPFNLAADIGNGAFREVVAPGAFSRTIASGADISALADHDGRALLGRTRSGTLKLTETAAGLEYSLDLPATAAGDDVCALATRGELAGCSIGFRIPKGGEEWGEGNRTRTLRAVDLHHVGIITGGDPAYSNTTASLRHKAPRFCPDALRRQRFLDIL